jgi:hypothetical protein
MEISKDFFTVQSMLTLSGSTGATFVVCNGLQRAFNFNPRWLGLVIAQIIVLVGVYASGGRSVADFFIGVINGFLVFCSATGATSALGSGGAENVVARGGTPAADAIRPQRAGNQRGFLSPWF